MREDQPEGNDTSAEEEVSIDDIVGRQRSRTLRASQHALPIRVKDLAVFYVCMKQLAVPSIL
jgi:hypothetical protein